MLQYVLSLRQFWLTKSSFFVHSTTRNAPYVHPRLDSILKLCRTFPIPVEHLSDVLGGKVRARRQGSVNLQELGVALQEEFQQIPRAAIRRISSMPDRCRTCVAASGGHIRY